MTLIQHPRMSHPFQRGVGGDRDESPEEELGDRDESPKEGWGDRDESPKRGVSQGGGLHQSQSRGGGGGQLCPLKTQYLLRRFWYKKDGGKVHTLLLWTLSVLFVVGKMPPFWNKNGPHAPSSKANAPPPPPKKIMGPLVHFFQFINQALNM